MAIIDKDTRMMVATRLANFNYKEQMDSSLAKLNELFEKYIIGKTPDDVLKCFKAHKKFFIRCNEPSLSSYNLPKTFFPEDWGSRGFIFTSSSLRNFLLLTKRSKTSPRNFLKTILSFSKSRNISFSSETVYFNDKPCPLVQVTENLDCYKQVDGAIYEISNGSPVE